MHPGTLSGSSNSLTIQHSDLCGLGRPLSLLVRLWFAASLVASLARIAWQLRFRDRSTYLSLACLQSNTNTIVSFAKPWLDSLPCADSLEKYLFCLMILSCRYGSALRNSTTLQRYYASRRTLPIQGKVRSTAILWPLKAYLLGAWSIIRLNITANPVTNPKTTAPGSACEYPRYRKIPGTTHKNKCSIMLFIVSPQALDHWSKGRNAKPTCPCMNR